MAQRPVAVGLLACQAASIEEGTRNVTLFNSFTRLSVDEFPSTPQRFTLFVLLTDGQGDFTMDLTISRPDSLEEVYRRSWPMHFEHPLRRERCLIRVSSCKFPIAGRYWIELSADREIIAQCVCEVHLRRNSNA